MHTLFMMLCGKPLDWQVASVFRRATFSGNRILCILSGFGLTQVTQRGEYNLPPELCFLSAHQKLYVRRAPSAEIIGMFRGNLHERECVH